MLNNYRKHCNPVRGGERDPCASATYDARRGAQEHVPISPPKTWLARGGLGSGERNVARWPRA